MLFWQIFVPRFRVFGGQIGDPLVEGKDDLQAIPFLAAWIVGDILFLTVLKYIAFIQVNNKPRYTLSIKAISLQPA